LEDRTVPSTFTVTTLSDGGAGSLRAAIDQANAAPDADTIVFAPGIAGGTTRLSTIGNTTLGPSAFGITSPITIAGTGETITRDGTAAAFRLFLVDTGGNLTLKNLTLSNGLAQGGDGGANGYGGGGGGAAGLGGGIFNQGTLSLNSVTLTGN